MDSQRDNLRVALLVAAAASVAAVVPIWPYGYYTLVRIVVTAVAVFAIVVLGNAPASRTVYLALFALLYSFDGLMGRAQTILSRTDTISSAATRAA